LHSHTISPVINKFDYKITEWDAADRLEYQGKAALVAGASIIFVAYAKLDLLETPEFTRFLERFKSHQHLNLFRYAENLSKIVLARGQNDTAALLAVNQEIAADEVRTQALWAKRQSIVDRISATNGSNAAWIARVQGDITRLQSILVPAKYESFTFALKAARWWASRNTSRSRTTTASIRWGTTKSQSTLPTPASRFSSWKRRSSWSTTARGIRILTSWTQASAGGTWE